MVLNNRRSVKTKIFLAPEQKITPQGRSFSTMQQVLGAAAWIVGEYCRPHLETVAKNHRRGQRVWFDVVQVSFLCILVLAFFGYFFR